MRPTDLADVLLGGLIVLEVWHLHLHMRIAIKIVRLETRLGIDDPEKEEAD
jgi:hypothetical protein